MKMPFSTITLILNILLSSCNNQIQQQPTEVELKTDTTINHAESATAVTPLKGLKLLKFFKDSIGFDRETQNYRLKLTVDDFFKDNMSYIDEYVVFFFETKGEIEKVSFPDPFLEIKLDTEESPLMVLQPKDPDMVKQMRKHLKVGHRIEAIQIIEGAKYSQFAELRAY